jgi:hypothetical protein
MSIAGEIYFMVQYNRARTADDPAAIYDVISTLPILMAADPSEGFVALLATMGTLDADMRRHRPNYRADAAHALFATAVDAVSARVATCAAMNNDLQTLLH